MHGRKPHPGPKDLLRRSASLLGLALFALLVASASARATTTVKKNTSGGVTTLTVVADSGEEHDIWIGWNETDQNYEVTDDAAPLQDNIGCTYVLADEQIVCPKGSPQVSVINITTGNQDDTVMIDLEGGEHAIIDTGFGDDFIQGLEGPDDVAAGPGDDVVDGADGRDIVDGGGGGDVIDGGGGDDWLSGAAGDDVLGGDQGADTFYGGTGVDTVDYSGSRSSVRVDLDGNADDGEAGEYDGVKPDIENIRGGSGDDTLTGSGQANLIIGGGGDDSIHTRDLSADRVLCGRGTDTATVDPRDSTDPTCETVDRAEAGSGSTGFRITIASCPGKPKGTATACLRIRCPGVAVSCAGNVSLEATVPTAKRGAKKRRRAKPSRVKVGSSAFKASAARGADVKVRLSKRAVGMLRAKGRLAARALVDARDESGHRESDLGAVHLTAKRKPAGHRR